MQSTLRHNQIGSSWSNTGSKLGSLADLPPADGTIDKRPPWGMGGCADLTMSGLRTVIDRYDTRSALVPFNAFVVLSSHAIPVISLDGIPLVPQ